jgi:hypothetical protein
MKMIVLALEDGRDILFVFPGPVGVVEALVRTGDDMKLGVRNACEVLET